MTTYDITRVVAGHLINLINLLEEDPYSEKHVVLPNISMIYSDVYNGTCLDVYYYFISITISPLTAHA